MRYPRRWHPLWLISVIGGLIWGGFIWNLLIELQTLSVVGPPIVTALLGTGLSLPLVYAGYRWQQEPWIDTSVGGRIVAWAISGLVFVTVTRGLTLFIHITENHAVANPRLDILIGLGAGTIVGAALGYLYERVRYDKSQIREARNALVFLNRTLRHECLNGLNIIQGHTATVANEVSDEDLQKRLDAVQTRSTDMADVIQNLRAFGEAFHGQEEPEPINLSAILTHRIALLRDTFPQANVTAEIPPKVYVIANETIERAFENVFQNAIEHNDKETPKVTIILEVGPEIATVHVKDNGSGIPETQRNRIFDPELDCDHRFGLYLVKSLITQYDGTIEISDNDPDGTVVSITLPRTDRAE